MYKINQMSGAYKLYKPKVVGQAFEKKQRKKMLMRMGKPPSPKKSRNSPHLLNPLNESIISS
jgi:hypothetical protein